MDKGFLAEIIPLGVSLFLIFFLAVVFFAWIDITITDRASIITSASSKSNIQYEILAFLQTPLKLDGESIHLSDALIVAAENPNSLESIKKQIESYLSKLPLPKEKCIWKISLFDAEKELLNIQTPNKLNSEPNTSPTGNLFIMRSSPPNEEVYSFQIPSYNNPGQFYTGNMGVECQK